jgi:hypothetical protein
MKMLILNVERISQKNGTTGNKLFPQGDGGQAGDTIPNSEKLSMVSPELRVPLQSGE